MSADPVASRAGGGPTFDVAIAGGGPAGCAVAIALRAHAPALSVVLLEATTYRLPRVGETLPPLVAPLLGTLGVGPAFAAQRHRPARGTAAAWGGPRLRENEFFLSPPGVGWHLDRAAFDAMLADQAATRGASVRTGARVAGVERHAGAWRLTLAPTGGRLSARFLVDATGPRAWIARRLGARPRARDRLTAFVRFFGDLGSGDARTLVEASRDGWWYTAPLPGGRRVAAYLSDADLARRKGFAVEDVWLRGLQGTHRVAPLLGAPDAAVPPLVRAAPSRTIDRVHGDGWIAVGDAAAVHDPLSSQGVLSALRSGVFAAYAIADRLDRGEDAGLLRYRRCVERDFEDYLDARAACYAEERRWPERPFWRRRHAPPSAPRPPRPSAPSGSGSARHPPESRLHRGEAAAYLLPLPERAGEPPGISSPEKW
jgi:flavin-dependent dehydrogenase